MNNVPIREIVAPLCDIVQLSRFTGATYNAKGIERKTRVKIRLKIQELDEFKALSEKDRTYVLEEYKKGYHFLLFYGKIVVVAALVAANEYLSGILRSLPRVYRFAIYGGLSYLVFSFISFIEINFIAKKVIRDLSKDSHKNHFHR